MNHNDVLVGKLGRSHGVKGFNTLHSFTQPEKAILEYTPWLLGSERQIVTLESFRVHHKKIIVRINGTTTPESAKELTNQEIFVSREALAHVDSNENYWHDIIGYQVVNQQGHVFGHLEQLFDSDSLVAMTVIDKQGNQLTIPFIRDKIVTGIDASSQTIKIQWPTP
ncbi:MAG: 16S rRNA processing protein RimM [Legionellales bacterium]|nr:16S rRNA processing protein RimM [Legionellales bacterium]|tara:strand:+ start:94 stop:594 length:501 start_codon:yes stop_codon:yes gene_type:complete